MTVAPAPTATRPPRLRASRALIDGVGTRLVDRLVWLGKLVIFVVSVVVSVPMAVTKHRKEVLRLVADVTFGRRFVAVAAGTVVVVFILATFLGISIGIQGYQGLQIIGLAPLAGLIAAYGNTRELIPLITSFGLASQMGCRFTAQLGAMRINDEIDALDVMAVPSLPYLVTTRVVAALVAVLPLYLVALSGSYLATQLTVEKVSHEGAGTYQHYFHAFLTPVDIVDSVAKVLIFSVVIIILHCYYGYTAGGGPEGVGRATGRAIRASIVALAILDLLLTMAFYGLSTHSLRLTG